MPSFTGANAKELLFWQRMKPTFLGASSTSHPDLDDRML
jgi:hypothetical protein